MALDHLRHLQFECMGPGEIEAALAKGSIAYLPLGTYEWHGRHLPVGLDSLKSHALCLQAAERTGGLVFPPFYYGTGGGHSAYPLTLMVGPELIRPILEATLRRLAEWGIRKAVLHTGHFAGEQVEMVKGIAAAWSDPRMKVIGVTDAELGSAGPLAPDHAAIYETSVLAMTHPELVHLERLPEKQAHPDYDVPSDDFWKHSRHETTHPLYGIFGPDPREFDPWKAAATHRMVVDLLVRQVEAM